MFFLRFYLVLYGKDWSEIVYLKINNKVEVKGFNYKILKLDNVEDRYFMKFW